MLPGAAPASQPFVVQPTVGELFATGWAEPAFAGERHVFTKLTILVAALVEGDAPDKATTGQHAHNVLNNGAAHRLPVLQIEVPPESIADKQLLQWIEPSDGGTLQA